MMPFDYMTSSSMVLLLKIIFLDIDGVLLPFPTTTTTTTKEDHEDENNIATQSLFPSSTVHALKYLLDETGADLVLSSTWRVRPDYRQDVVDCLQQGYGIKMDQFYDITDPNMHSERQWEIAQWLQLQSSNDQADQPIIIWLALDDENLLDGDANQKYRQMFEGHVIQTMSDVGLTMEDAIRGVQLWKKQLSSLVVGSK
jgi:hypothetical protein